jgi:choline kinase
VVVLVSRPAKAVIVAAGQSSRLYPLTIDTPKGLLDVGGESMLARSVRLLREHGLRKIAVVVGFHRRKVQDHLRKEDIVYLYNPFFAETNNLGSLFLAKEWVSGNPFLYLHSDIVYHQDLLERMLTPLKGSASSLLVEVGPTGKEAMKVRVVSGRFVESGKHIMPVEALGEWVGIAAFSSGAVAPLFNTIEKIFEERLFQAYDTEAFTRMARDGMDFEIIPTAGRPWIEVDFIEDLHCAQEMFFS